jgi:hypothetical protein
MTPIPYTGPTPQSFEDCRKILSDQSIPGVNRIPVHLSCLEVLNASKKSASSSTNNNSTADSSPDQQRAQAQINEVQQRTREVQARADADAQRKGKRSHDPAAEAHQCLTVDPSGLFGAMVNSCPYKVWYTFCAYKPRESNALKDTLQNQG